MNLYFFTLASPSTLWCGGRAPRTKASHEGTSQPSTPVNSRLLLKLLAKTGLTIVEATSGCHGPWTDKPQTTPSHHNTHTTTHTHHTHQQDTHTHTHTQLPHLGSIHFGSSACSRLSLLTRGLLIVLLCFLSFLPFVR